MNCIKKLTDENFGFKTVEFKNPKHRLGARGIVLNDNGLIAILYAKNKNEYKLIGGGLENNENPLEAFEREVLEETGYKIVIDECLGTIEEYRTQGNLKQTSYVYISHVVEKVSTSNFTKKELEDGSEILWLNIEDTINLIQNCENKLSLLKKEDCYHIQFIVRRDYEILIYYKKLLEKNMFHVKH